MGKMNGGNRKKQSVTPLSPADYAILSEGHEVPQLMSDLQTTSSLARSLEAWSSFSPLDDSSIFNATNGLDVLDCTGDAGFSSTIDAAPGHLELPEIYFTTPNSSESGPTASDISCATSKNSPSASSNMSDTDNIIELTAHIRDLSQNLAHSPLALDRVLSVSSPHLDSINFIIRGLPSGLSHTSTVLMAIICLTQILGLFEDCLDPSQRKTFFGVTSGPKLLFGSFQVDLESHREMLKQILRKELIKMFDVSKSIIQILQQTPMSAVSQNQTYLTLMADFQRRVQFLSHIVSHS